MKNEKLVCREVFGVADADLVADFLKDKAAEGWKVTKMTSTGRFQFEKAEPEEKTFAWECMLPDEKGAVARGIQRDTIERQRKNGWEHEGTFGPLLFFSAKEEIPFEHWGGEAGRKDCIFGWLAKQKKSVLVNGIIFSAIVVYMLMQLLPMVQVDEYLEWGLSGAFCLLYDNNSLVLFAIMLICALTNFIGFLQLPSVKKGKETVTQAIREGHSIRYGEAQEYEKRKAAVKKAKKISWILMTVLMLLFVVTMAQVSTGIEMIVFVAIMAAVSGIIWWIQNRTQSQKWGTLKQVFAAVAATFALVIIVGVIITVFEPDTSTEEEWNALNEYTYPPSYFGLESYKNMEWTSLQSGSIFGTYEELDVYHMGYDETNPFDYNYYRYIAGTDFLAGILREQALKNLEPYDAEKLDIKTNGWTVYRIEWSESEQWFYTDTFLMMRDREILLVNVYLEEIPFEKVLEIFLSQTPAFVI